MIKDLRLFWQSSLIAALLVAVYIALYWPAELLAYVGGVAMGGLYWSSVARRTHWLAAQTALSGKQKWFAIGLGLATVAGLSAGVGLLAIKHPIVFVGLFIYKLGILACFVRSLSSH